MADEPPKGHYWIRVPGFDEPFEFPDSVDSQTASRKIRQHYGHLFEQRREQERLNPPPTPEQGLSLGMGSTGEMLWENLKRIPAGLQGVMGDPGPMEAINASRAESGPVDAYLREKQPGTFGTGQMLPYFAPPAGVTSKPVAGLLSRLGMSRIPAAAKVPEYVGRSVVADASMTGAALGGLSDDSSAVEGGAYGAGGGFLGKALSRALKPADTVLDPQAAQLAATGERLGYKLLPSQMTGSRGQAILEDAMQNNLLTSGGFDKIARANQANSNRIVAEALGFRDKVRTGISPSMLDQVSERFSKQFKDLTDGQAVNLNTDELLDGLARLEADNVDYIIYNKDFGDVVNRTLDLMTKNSGWVSGKDYQILSSKLVRGIRANFKPGGNPEFGQQLAGIKELLDDAAEASLGKDQLQRFRDVRSDYRTYASLMKNSVINEDTGDVSLRQLGNVLRREDKRGYRQGKNKSDLYEATRVTRGMPGEGMNSLTARRQSLPQTMMGMGLFGMLGASQSEESSGAAGLAGAVGFPASLFALGKYYNSPAGRKHFGKGLLGPISDDFRRYLGQKTGLATIAASQVE